MKDGTLSFEQFMRDAGYDAYQLEGGYLTYLQSLV